METAAKKIERHIQFDDFSFDTASEELFRMGERVPMQPQPARLLGLFLANAGELLNREDIRRHIWPDTLVDYEQRIASAVRAIRTALADDRANPRYIETVARKGYRFIGLNDQMQVGDGGANRWKMMAVVGGALLAGTVLLSVWPLSDQGAPGPAANQRLVLAVLPVKEFSGAATSAFPVEGLTNEIIVQATRIAPEKLAVIARTSAMTFHDTELTIGGIAEAVGADYVLETSLSQQEGTVRITASLVEAETEQNLWSSSFDRPTEELPAIEQEIVQNIAASLGLEQVTRPPLRQSTNPEAYNAYVTGLYLLGQRSADDVARSYEYFSQAISHDPRFAPAYVGIARSASSAGKPEAARPAIEQALALDDTIAEAHMMRGRYRFFTDWDWQGAATDFEAAVRLQPGRAEFHSAYALYLTTAGEYDKALAQNARALESDPLSGAVNGDIGYLYLRTGQYDRAIEHCRRTMNIFAGSAGGGVFARNCLMQASLLGGDIDSAADYAVGIMELRGAAAESLAVLRVLEPRQQIEAFWTWSLAYHQGLEAPNLIEIAFAHAALGDADPAINALEKALGEHIGGLLFIGFDPRYDNLRTDPRFQRIVEAVGVPGGD